MKAGVATRDISPTGPAFLVGFPHIERRAQGVHDPLLASALCLRNDTTAVLLVALDLLFIDPTTARELRRRVAQRTGIAEAGVFISCSHTHSGPHTCYVLEWGPSPVVPPVDPAYMEFLAESVAEAAAEAASRLREAEAAWCTGAAAGVGGNRHDPKHGKTDPEVGILAVRERATKRLFALSMVYSMHPTVLHEDSRWVSSDFPHYTRELLKARIAPDLTVLCHTGPEGDQSPRYHVTANTFAEAERVGGLLGAAVYESVCRLGDGDFSPDPALGGRLAAVTLPRRTLPSAEAAAASLSRFREIYGDLKKRGAPHGPVRTAECDVFGAEETAYLAECQKSGHLAEVLERYTPIDVQVVRIGDACLAGFPGELFVAYGLEVKRRAGRTCFPVTLVNGDLQGYVVTREAVEKGFYESNNRVFEPEAGAVLVEAALSLLKQL